MQRFIICIVQNIELEELRLQSVDSTDIDPELHAYGEMLEAFRGIPDSQRLRASEAAKTLRDNIYTELMTAIAMNANDPQAAYSARLFDNYFWRFCIIIHLMKHWRELRDAMREGRVETWFRNKEVDEETAAQAWYLCEYYFENTKPFLRQMSEQSMLDGERKILRLLQKAPDMKMNHSRLLCKTRMTSRDFRKTLESLLERQAILRHEEQIGYRNRVKMDYSLNPVLEHVDLN